MPQTQTINYEKKANLATNAKVPEVVYSEANLSKNGVVYFPFKNENETIEWIDDVVSEWWDDETI